MFWEVGIKADQTDTGWEQTKKYWDNNRDSIHRVRAMTGPSVWRGDAKWQGKGMGDGQVREKTGLIGTEVIRWSEQRAKPATTTESPSCDRSCLKPAQLLHACRLLIHEPGSKGEEARRGKHPTSLHP